MSTRTLRVLHVITGLGQGGAESVLFRLATYPEAGVEHTVISLTDEGIYGERLRAAGVAVRALGMKRGRVTLGGFMELRRLIADARPDAVQTWMYHADLIGGLAARLAGVRAIAWGIRNSGEHLERSSRSARLVLRACALLSGRVPKAIVCAAQKAAQRHADKGYRRDRLVVISNGYDLSRYTPDAAARARARAEWGVVGDAPVIGCVARWDPLKDHANLLRAVAALVRDGRDAGLRCVLIGRGMTADNPELGALIDRLGLRERLVLAGPSDDVPAAMNGLDLHVLSSCAEGFPNVVAEAMACGVYCVVTDVGDAAYIVGDTGVVVPAEQAEALARGIETALREVAARGRERAGEPARARVLEHFDLARMVQSYIAVWRRISGVQA
ncbi:glycosyltransferase family 4 protein [Achromobacter denitrificans]|jgi:glycosyltransferase involved in cell wall biosynthesis|uniref:glycosyltransferase family 4 protein n=1 Tax=Achromobacter denitrificans TaxID=32002 RepID=UPI000787C96E|nr:glycosyltransferase [Achromobacter denitrificans]OLU02433.1 glycosyl transferase [Achromobacter denitrificans]QKH43345.1 glycosyltransferase [Achromobacter denitrificans]QKH49514.1 glycosyltransferase [Achromobacter denitrificans]CAB3741455.1 Putative glycosyltransferase EpsF [Achromobacter denitrificans]CAB3911483.1 Putative glycosyltransferase EpsF [Achromobacter denitrificans]